MTTANSRSNDPHRRPNQTQESSSWALDPRLNPTLLQVLTCDHAQTSMASATGAGGAAMSQQFPLQSKGKIQT